MPLSVSPRTFIPILLLVLVAALAAASRVSAPGAILLETQHLAVLEPHEHDEGDSASDAGHHVYLLSGIYTAPEDLWISGFSFELVHASSSVIHHLSLLDHDAPHQTCASLPFSQLFILAQDTMHHPFMDFPDGYAEFVPKGHRLQLSVMVHNPEPPVGAGDEYHDVFGRLTLTLATSSLFSHPKLVHPYLMHLDENPCVIREPDQSDAYVFSVPPHTKDFEMQSTDTPGDPSVYTFKKRSTILYIGAHLHGWQGGKRLEVVKNGEPYLTFQTERSADDPYRFDTPYYPTSLQMQPGDTLSLRAYYDNPDAVATRGAMGDLGIYFFEQ